MPDLSYHWGELRRGIQMSDDRGGNKISVTISPKGSMSQFHSGPCSGSASNPLPGTARHWKGGPDNPPPTPQHSDPHNYLEYYHRETKEVDSLIGGYPGRASSCTKLRVHSIHHHVRDTILVLEEGKPPNPIFLRCNIFVPWQPDVVKFERR